MDRRGNQEPDNPPILRLKSKYGNNSGKNKGLSPICEAVPQMLSTECWALQPPNDFSLALGLFPQPVQPLRECFRPREWACQQPDSSPPHRQGDEPSHKSVNSSNRLSTEQALITVTILYPTTANSHFDSDYYINKHMPLTIKLLAPALQRVTVEIGTFGATPDQAPPFAAICTFTCASVDAFTQALLPVARVLQSDIANYTNIEPVIQFSDLRISR